MTLLYFGQNKPEGRGAGQALFAAPMMRDVQYSYDNALAETINGWYKAELFHRRTWKTRKSVELATLQWVAWFNHHRLVAPLGYIPPAEAEANYYRQLETATAESVLT